MANQPQTQPQPQQAASPHMAEQVLLAAGAQPQHIQQARALGLDAQGVLALLVKMIPILIEGLQGLQQRGGGQPQTGP